MDAKGRALLPSGLKKQMLSALERGFVLKRSVFSSCLELYPMDEWDQVMARVNKLNRFVKKNNDFVRMFMAGVKLIEMDASGRIQFPKDLVGYAGLSSSLVLSATGSIIEVWDKEQYEASVNPSDVDFAALAEEVMGGISDLSADELS
ncbi:MAG: division/cell wall cluster transcriptional repressor MraZ [Schleiferiaceae bacterium]|jgi:MraZ protein